MKIYELRKGDTVRVMTFTLLRNGAALAQQPTSAKLKVTTPSGVIQRDLVASTGQWTYQVVDGDFAVMVPGTASVPNEYKGEILATFSGGTATLPTRGAITIRVYDTR